MTGDSPVAPMQDRVVAEVENLREELVQFAAELVRVPTVNPPGEFYRDCAELIGAKLQTFGFEVEYVEAEGRPEHTAEHPRVNVVGRWAGRRARPLVHLNGHFDVVPAGDGWSLDPFAGVVRDGRLYGRGSADMKSGIACAVYAAEALRRAGVQPNGSLEVSGTVDEESGGFAGVAYLAETGRISHERTDYVIIPEPLDVDRICIGHRGVYWFKVTVHGKIAHGSMPFAGVNAIERMNVLIEKIRRELVPAIAKRTTAMPVVPAEARRGSLNINSISGGQAGAQIQTPCVADRCEATFDRRFLIEEDFEATRAEIEDVLKKASEDDAAGCELTDLLVVHPTQTPKDSPLVNALRRSVRDVLGKDAELVASPGTYDHKHVARIAGVEHCVAYGPGRLAQAHQADEWCAVDDMLNATKVLALSLIRLGESGA